MMQAAAAVRTKFPIAVGRLDKLGRSVTFRATAMAGLLVGSMPVVAHNAARLRGALPCGLNF